MNDAEARDLLAQAAQSQDQTDFSLPGQEDGTAEGGATPNSSNSVDEYIQAIQENPDAAAEVITKMQRDLGGRYGGELQKLRNEMQQEKEQLLARLDDNKPVSTEPDEHGLTDEEYARLGAVIAKTKEYQELKQSQTQVDASTKESQAQTFLANLKNQYGDAITESDINTLHRTIRLAGYDGNNADLQAVYNDIVQVAEARKAKAPIEQEAETRADLQRRVSASQDAPTSQGALRSDDLGAKLKNDRGRITDENLVAVGREYMRRLDRMR